MTPPRSQPFHEVLDEMIEAIRDIDHPVPFELVVDKRNMWDALMSSADFIDKLYAVLEPMISHCAAECTGHAHLTFTNGDIEAARDVVRDCITSNMRARAWEIMEE